MPLNLILLTQSTVYRNSLYDQKLVVFGLEPYIVYQQSYNIFSAGFGAEV